MVSVTSEFPEISDLDPSTVLFPSQQLPTPEERGFEELNLFLQIC
jgi:hypothetical protein